MEVGGLHERALLILAADWTLKTFSEAQLTHFRSGGYCEEITAGLEEMAGCAFVQLGDTERFSYLESVIWGTMESDGAK